MGDKDTKLAVIAIVVEKEEGVRELNELLHGCSGYIIGRMGIPHSHPGQKKAVFSVLPPQSHL